MSNLVGRDCADGNNIEELALVVCKGGLVASAIWICGASRMQKSIREQRVAIVLDVDKDCFYCWLVPCQILGQATLTRRMVARVALALRPTLPTAAVSGLKLWGWWGIHWGW